MDFVRLGIIGVGNMGSAHANCIYNNEIKGLKLVAICDKSPFRRDWAKENFKDVEVFETYQELIDSKTVDAIIIAVPHPMHADIAMYALKNGLNVLVEKPVDVTVTKAKALNEIAEKSGKVFAIMFNQRTNEIFIKARGIIKSGVLGNIKRNSWVITNWYRPQSYYDSGSWRASWRGEGGGVLINQSPHNLDLWQWICGEPEEISAIISFGKFHNIEVDDEATIYAKYPGGATGTFITSTGELPGTNRLEIACDKGKMVLENGMLKIWKLSVSEREFCFDDNKGPTMTYEEFECDAEIAHKGILQNFANAILYGEELISPGTDGIKELSISNAAYLSAWKDSVPVKLPLDNKEFDEYFYKKVEASSFDETKESHFEGGCYLPRWFVNW